MREMYCESGIDEMTNVLLAVEAFLLFIDIPMDQIEKIEAEMKNSENTLLQQAASWSENFDPEIFAALIVGDRYSELLDKYFAALLSRQSDEFMMVLCLSITCYKGTIFEHIDVWLSICKVIYTPAVYPSFHYYHTVFEYFHPVD